MDKIVTVGLICMKYAILIALAGVIWGLFFAEDKSKGFRGMKLLLIAIIVYGIAYGINENYINPEIKKIKTSTSNK